MAFLIVLFPPRRLEYKRFNYIASFAANVLFIYSASVEERIIISYRLEF